MMDRAEAMAEDPPGALYVGRVMHARLRPFGHRFSYRVFQLYLDIDQIAAAVRGLRLLSYNRPGALSFYDKDHGPRTGEALRPWVEARFSEAGLAPPKGSVRLLTFPRVFGYVFNPISIYYAFGAHGGLEAVLYEVNNTFGDTIAYAAPVEGRGLVRQMAPKRMHVSPFMEMEADYHFALRPPGERLTFAIRQQNDEGPLLFANMALARRPLSDGALLKAALTHPFLTHKVTGAIHWEALRLWLKGARYVPRPTPPQCPVSTGRARPTSGACPIAAEGQQ